MPALTRFLADRSPDRPRDRVADRAADRAADSAGMLIREGSDRHDVAVIDPIPSRRVYRASAWK